MVVVGGNFSLTVDIQLLEVLGKYTSARLYSQSFYEFRQLWNASSFLKRKTSRLIDIEFSDLILEIHFLFKTF